MLRILLAILSIVTIVFIPTNTTALTTNTYQIEVIVFSHLTSTGVSQENWPQTYITPFNLENSTTLFQDTDNQNLENPSIIKEETPIEETPIEDAPIE